MKTRTPGSLRNGLGRFSPVALLVTLAGTAASANEPQRVAVEDLLPASTLFAVYTPDVEEHDKLVATLPLSKILAEPEVAAFLEKPKKAIDEVLAKLQDRVRQEKGFEDFSINMNEMTGGKYGRVFVALTHVTLPDAPGSDPDVGLVIGIERREGAYDWNGQIKSLVSRIAAAAGQQGVAFESEMIEGTGHTIDVLRGADEANRPPVILAEVDGMQLMSLSRATIADVISRAKERRPGALSSSPHFAACVKEIGAGAANYSTMYINLEGVTTLVRSGAQLAMAAVGEGQFPVDALERVYDRSGLSALKAAMWSSGVRDGASYSIGHMLIEGERRGLLAAAQTPTMDPNRLKAVPDNAASFSLGSMSVTPFYDFAMDAFKEIAPEVHAEFVAHLGEFEAMIGGSEQPISVREDLFQNLGPNYLSLAPKKASMMTQLPPMLAALEVRNPDRVVEVIRKVVEFAGVQTGNPMKVESEERKGYTLHEISLGGELSIVRPAFAVAGGQIYLSTEPALIKQHMKRLEKADATDITASPDFQRFAKHVPWDGLSSLTYSDTRYSFETAYDMIISTVPMFMQMSDIEVPIDFQIAPMRETISQHLFGGLTFSVETPTGTRYESYGSIGGEAAAFAIAALAGAGLVGASQQMETEFMRMGDPQEAESPTRSALTPEEVARNDLKLLSSNVVLYRLEKDALPSTLDDLLSPLPNYPSGLLDGQSLPVDPWGQKYMYAVSGTDYRIWSAGPDGVDNDGSGDDILRASKQ
jgi:Type II secretion system (T2SS), protein G